MEQYGVTRGVDGRHDLASLPGDLGVIPVCGTLLAKALQSRTSHGDPLRHDGPAGPSCVVQLTVPGAPGGGGTLFPSAELGKSK